MSAKPRIKLCHHGINEKYCKRCGGTGSTVRLSDDQSEAIAQVMGDDGPFFLTGQAGSGKSFVVEQIRRRVKKCVVTASTGMAAQLISGRTFHSFLGLRPNATVEKSYKADKRVRDCNLLIVDEASMISAELLEQAYERFEYAEHEPKLLMVGDFLQLPPVSRDDDPTPANPLYESDRWPGFSRIVLTQQHRQNDAEFISVLNDIRVGNLSDAVRDLIERRRVADLPDDCVHLMARKRDVENRNLARLNSLDARPCVAQWKLTPKAKVPPDWLTPEWAAKVCRYPQQLVLKEGCRVVLLNNDQLGRWVNGSTGVVREVIPGSVTVELDSGSTVYVEKDVQNILNGDGQSVCEVEQYPIALAWALTIHKAQGMTLDRVGVDLNNHFEMGQTYTAISRCRSERGLFLTGDLIRILVNARALELCN